MLYPLYPFSFCFILVPLRSHQCTSLLTICTIPNTAYLTDSLYLFFVWCLQHQKCKGMKKGLESISLGTLYTSSIELQSMTVKNKCNYIYLSNYVARIKGTGVCQCLHSSPGLLMSVCSLYAEHLSLSEELGCILGHFHMLLSFCHFWNDLHYIVTKSGWFLQVFISKLTAKTSQAEKVI